MSSFETALLVISVAIAIVAVFVRAARRGLPGGHPEPSCIPPPPSRPDRLLQITLDNPGDEDDEDDYLSEDELWWEIFRDALRGAFQQPGTWADDVENVFDHAARFADEAVKKYGQHRVENVGGEMPRGRDRHEVQKDLE